MAAVTGASFIVTHLSQQLVALAQPRAWLLLIVDAIALAMWLHCTLGGLWRSGEVREGAESP